MNMKKIIPLLIAVAVIIAAVVTIVLVTGNSNNDNNDNDTPVEKQYDLSIGVAVTPNLYQNKASQTVAAIVTDTDGKIVLCRFDCIDFVAKYTDGTLDTTAPISKAAQGDKYDESNPMPAGRWYAQVDALAKHLIGKTQAEVAAIALEGGKLTDAELSAQCSIAVTDLLKAVDNAFKSEHKTAFKSSATNFTAGIAVLGAIKDAETDTAKNATFTADFASSVLVDGKVVASILDSTEVMFKGITDDGAEKHEYAGTKREQGEAYDSYKPMAAGTWYVQADAYVKAAIGKSASDISTIAAEGVAGCTIYAGGYKQVLEAAVKAAK